MNSAEIRQRFLDFFRRHGHEVVPSSPLVPANDPTLLFTNAGMVQFKDVFLGLEKRAYARAASSQRCVRAGGKHNDLENVGYTARHHTFFEMLGNFSFGDYFKREAIAYAWEFLTRELALAPDRLWVTVYKDDDEAADIWLSEIGVDAKRLSRLGEKDNFWSMGDTGPCGPCSEIFYDHGPEVAGGPPGTPEEDGDRYVEIWNLVFMQYNRDSKGKLTPLPKPSVDTGMGLERLAAVMQGVHSNYDIDLFQNLIKAVSDLSGAPDLTNPSLRVIADHIRSCSFLITDGVLPSNEGRGYVLRRIIRRAARHGHKLGLDGPFLYKLVRPLVAEMGAAYPELKKTQPRIESVLEREEEKFAKTLERGLKILEEDIKELSGDTISGETVFELYATYGFPVDLTNDIARERGLTLDMQGYGRKMKEHQELGGAGEQFEVDYSKRIILEGETAFTGYESLVDEGEVVALFKTGEPVEALKKGEEGMVVLRRTPFYAESGGQVGDRGTLSAGKTRFEVVDTQKQGQVHVHIGRLISGRITKGDRLKAAVDAAHRQATVLNHSATHLMHAALREVLGEHVQQKGSLVTPDRLRFDFSHFEPLKPEELAEVERIVNEQIRENADADVSVMSMDEALDAGAVALFGEKYGEQVRVMRIGFSTELCGGTHVHRAGDIGLFKIVSEGGVAAGIRRIEAVTGPGALAYINQGEVQLQRIAERLRGSREDAETKVEQLQHRVRSLEKELEKLQGKLATGSAGSLADQAVDVHGVKVLAARVDGTDAKGLREAVDRLRDKLGHAAVVLAAVREDKVSLVAGVTKDLTQQLHAGELIKQVAAQVGGKGGGRADMAQAGGDNPAALDAALAGVTGWVEDQLSRDTGAR